ncbi:MAG: hypothetical protein KJ799_10340 [Bacteroidetes bacterium]|nr:hypothetical protein [Bacteroidota bacterium]MBU1678092.1 hypothetical protein [Bacteroidota bacterium]MBU2507106.1 hypothetical protein [Bacteroidota bacterium]
MVKLSDEILNKFIDNELNSHEVADIKEIVDNDSVELKKLQAHSAVHKILNTIDPLPAPSGITARVMSRIALMSKSSKAEDNFIYIILSLFFASIIAVLGYTIFQVNGSGESSAIFINFNSFISSYLAKLDFVKSITSNDQFLLIGASLTFMLLISAYYIFESHKSFKQKLNKNMR